MWTRLFAVIFLFYVLGLFSNNFFVHFAVWGARLDFIFIFFFILVFFSKDNRIFSFESLFYCFVAGFFADIFSLSRLGTSFVLFLLFFAIFKKIFNSLKQKKDKRPIVYFTPLFLGFFTAYNFFLAAYSYFFPYFEAASSGQDILSFIFLIKVAYNLMIAVLGFYIYKIFQKIYKDEF